jgi:hypothetical protein
VDIAGVQSAIAAYFPCYVRMLRWSQHGNVVTAVPKKPLGDQAHQLISKAFHSCGGRYVRRGGVSYFELVLKEAEQKGSPFSYNSHGQFSPATQCAGEGALFSRLENQLSSLSEAGRQCTET